MSCAEDIAFEISNLREIEAEQRKIFVRVDNENNVLIGIREEREKELKVLKQEEREIKIRLLSTEDDNYGILNKVRKFDDRIKIIMGRKSQVERSIIKSSLKIKTLEKSIEEEKSRYENFLENVREQLYLFSPSGHTYQESKANIANGLRSVEHVKDEIERVKVEIEDLDVVLKEESGNLNRLLKIKNGWKKRVRAKQLKKDQKLLEIEDINRDKEIEVKVDIERLMEKKNELRDIKNTLIRVEKNSLRLKSLIKEDIGKFRFLQQKI